MIRIASRPALKAADWHKGFLSILPIILPYARIGFRHLTPEARYEAVAECVANAFVAYHRLLELNKPDLIYPTVLAK